MKRNGCVWCAENHSIAVGHEKSGFNAKNARIWLTLALKVHPDKNPDDPDAAEKCRSQRGARDHAPPGPEQ
ncbi:hypothetical protein NP493_597g04043 [Ridgeia piscesae]|uniref:J domain-containing protein n=1 Tax=Ridgeia piscesae TaxID=27915 RepID=A0AAD9KUB0_RIDPI|nr:hypothetical protein NP493_597g04043 [Ridgeia piscesae]